MLARLRQPAQITDGMFRVLAKASADGVVDVFASDQHGSFLKMLAQAPGLVPSGQPTDKDVGKAGWHIARALPEGVTAALFNNLAFGLPKFLDQLPKRTMLIARLERSKFDTTPDGKGQVPVLDVEPVQAKQYGAKAVKILLKLNPDHKVSWKSSYDWLMDVWQKCLKLDMPLFNEVLYDVPGMSKVELGKRLPKALVKMAEKFGSIGTFFKTQAPFLWVEDEGKLVRVCDPDTVRQVTKTVDEIVPLPVLLLSAAVDFDQYMYQFCLAAENICGPMCGRAYFKEAPKVAKNWRDLEEKIKQIAHPRIAAIKALTSHACQPWWQKMRLSPEAKKMLNSGARMKGSGVDISAAKGMY